MWTILIWALLPVAASLAQPGEQQISASDIVVDWPADAREVHRWLVRDHPQSDSSHWRSLINRAGPDQRISQHLSLDMADMAADRSWLPIAAQPDFSVQPSSIVQRWVTADGSWQLERWLKHAGIPYRLELVIELTRTGDPGQSSASAVPIRMLLGPGLGEEPIEGLGIANSLYSFVEPVIRTGGSTDRIPLSGLDDIQTVALSGEVDETWFGLNSRYFALLLNPVAGTDLSAVAFRLAKSPLPETLPSRYLPVVAVELEPPDLATGQSVSWQFEIFSGPKSRAALAGTADGSDYSGLLFHSLWRWMRGLSFGLLRILEWLHGLVPSWGLAICLLAVLVRLILYPLARWALSSQHKFSDVQRRIQPEMAHIKKKYKGGEQSERILQLYEKHGVSPLAGLKPLLIVLIQIPVFVALFHVLGQAFELRQASFLWMDSLAEPDRLFGFGVDLPFFGAYFNVLPVLMALSTLITIKLSPAPASSDAERRRQHIFMILMTLAFFLLFYPFPSGMVLYWTIANVLHIVQSRITRPPANTIAAT